jgi:putative toxin-antitoxin system antitoxin component (TIGR02293 family)
MKASPFRHVFRSAAKWRTMNSHMANPARHHPLARRGEAAATPPNQDLAAFGRLVASGQVGINSHVLLLGLHPVDTPQLVTLLGNGLSYGVFDRLLASSALTPDLLQTLIDVPLRTLARRKQEGCFRSDESDRLVRAARVVGRALMLFEGHREAAARWLSTPQRGLGGAVPAEFARLEVGALEVERLLQRLEHGLVA